MIEKLATIGFLGIFAYLMLSAYLLRFFVIPEEAIKQKEVKSIIRHIVPPLAVLTPLGKRIWWSRIIAIPIGLFAIFLAFYFQNSNGNH